MSAMKPSHKTPRSEAYCGNAVTPGRYAALDIGTVTCRMLIADVDEQGVLTELKRLYRITNLGEGVDATGLLKPEAINRVVEVVSDYLQVLKEFEPQDGMGIALTAMATSASRDAKNASEFQERLASLGVELSVILGKKEAALSFNGAATDFSNETLLVVDIGGGSTEIIVGAAGEQPRLSHSFNIGCRRVTEKFLFSDPPSLDEKQSAARWIDEEFEPYFASIQNSGLHIDRMVAVAGTATTVVAVRDALEVYCTEKVHKAEVTETDLRYVAERFERVNSADRAQIVGLDPGRAPVIVAGMIILQSVLRLSGLSSFTVSERDILHGMISEAARI